MQSIAYFIDRDEYFVKHLQLLFITSLDVPQLNCVVCYST